MKTKPVVLCFSGLDPTGGAGIQADIEAINSHGCHTTPIITALTIQDTHNVQHFEIVSPQLLRKQAETVLNDMKVHAIKIGMLGSVSIADAVHCVLRTHPHIPVILDPILAAGGGSELADAHLIEAINKLILPYTLITTPNIPEALRLARVTQCSHQQCIHELAKTGVKYILLTGTHDDTHHVRHRLFRGEELMQEFHYDRLDNSYHGSGCTLAASLAALIAQGIDIVNATQNALDYSYHTLTHAHTLGGGQLIPNRYFWANNK
jgi:hydroxymethylpyrimidine/phosphomethylpyrimidine kinase